MELRIPADGKIYISGISGEGAAPEFTQPSKREKKSLDNINAMFEESGMASADVESMQVYIADGALFDRSHTTYKAYVKLPKTASTTVVISKPVGTGQERITATARK